MRKLKNKICQNGPASSDPDDKSTATSHRPTTPRVHLSKRDLSECENTRHNMLAWLSFIGLERFLLRSQDLVNPKRRRVQWRFKTAKEILVKSVMRCFWGLVNTIRANHFQSGSVAPPHQLKGCNSCQIYNSNRQFIINNQWPTIHNQWLLHSSK